MKHTRLKFPSAIYLIAFRRYSKASYWDIDLNALTVHCDCSKKEIQSACRDFGAEIVEHAAVMDSSVKEIENIPFSVNRMIEGKMIAAV